MSFISVLLEGLLYLFIIILPLAPQNFNLRGIPLNGDSILALFFLTYFVSLLFKSERLRLMNGIRDFFKSPLSLFMSALFVIMLISISYALEKKLAFSETLRFGTYLLLFFIIKYKLHAENVRKNIIRVTLLTTFILSLVGSFQYLTGLGINHQFISAYDFGSSVRLASTLDNPNAFGAFLILIIFPMVMLAITRFKVNAKAAVIYSLIAFLAIINLILTYSRNAWLGLALGSLVLIIIYSWRLIFIFGLLGAGSLFIPQISRRLMDIFDMAQNISRIKLWKTALLVIKDHPLWGVGNGNFVSYYDQYIKKYPELSWGWRLTRVPTHNSYLKIESELGVLGIIAFLGSILAAFFRVKKLVSTSSDSFFKPVFIGFLASMTAFYFMNISDNLFFVPKVTTYFWLMLAVSEGTLFKTFDSANRRALD